MRRLIVDQEVALSVGDTTVDCRVDAIDGGEVVLAPLSAEDSNLLPPASASASLVFQEHGRLVMLRGTMYRATGGDELRFAERSSGSGVRPMTAEQRRKAARVPITLPATIRLLDERGEPFGEDRQLITRDVSIGGFAVETGVGGLAVGTMVVFDLILTSGATIAGTARVVRAAHHMSGLRFEKLPPAERVRLAGFLAGHQTGRAPQPALGALAGSGR